MNKKIKEFLINNNLPLSIYDKLYKYYEMIENENKKYNLTSFSGHELWDEGIYNSIKNLNSTMDFNNIENKKILDIGAGSGLSSIPLLICFPFLDLTLIESNHKKANFIKEVAKELNLKVKIFNQRIETFFDEKFDIIIARAVANLRVLIEISYHLGKENAKYIFLKGRNIKKEIEEANSIINFLKIEFDIKEIEINNKQNYNFVYYKKNLIGFKPRIWSKIKKYKF